MDKRDNILPVRENKKVDMGKAIKLRFKNELSYQAIADYAHEKAQKKRQELRESASFADG